MDMKVKGNHHHKFTTSFFSLLVDLQNLSFEKKFVQLLQKNAIMLGISIHCLSRSVITDEINQKAWSKLDSGNKTTC